MAELMTDSHYLKDELYRLVSSQPEIFDFLQEGSLDGLWYWDLQDPEHEWMNARFWELLGYDPAERQHLASEWQDLIHPDDLKLALENFQKHCEDPSHPYDQVVRYRHRNGRTIWVRCRGIAIRDESGTPVRMLGAHNDLTELYELQERLREKAYRDSLTGLANRYAFQEHFDWAIKHLRRSPSRMSLAMLDIDRFKAINDQHGHLAGDTVLSQVGEAIQKGCRESDYAARWGGEEFIVVLHETDRGAAKPIGERLRSEIERLSTSSVPVTVSIGLATPDIRSDQTTAQILDQSLREADRALYAAKAAGRNRVMHFEEVP